MDHSTVAVVPKKSHLVIFIHIPSLFCPLSLSGYFADAERKAEPGAFRALYEPGYCFVKFSYPECYAFAMLYLPQLPFRCLGIGCLGREGLVTPYFDKKIYNTNTLTPTPRHDCEPQLQPLFRKPVFHIIHNC